MTAPLVTCGVTAYNAASTIERAIGSVLAQRHQPIEVIVVDDCSVDGTLQILKRLEATSAILRVIPRPFNQGVAAARNCILNEAKGEFVAFFDDDDESHPDRLSRQLDRILQYERDFAGGGPVICHTARNQIYPDGSLIVSSTIGEDPDRRAPAGIEVAERILTGKQIANGNGACATSSQMARLSTYRAAGGFDATFRRSEDTELNVRLAAAGCHFAGIAEPLVTQTMTVSSDKRLAEERFYSLQMLQKHRDLLDRAQYAFCLQWIDSKYAWMEDNKPTMIFGFARLLLLHPVLLMRRIVATFANVSYNRKLRRFHELADKIQ